MCIFAGRVFIQLQNKPFVYHRLQPTPNQPSHAAPSTPLTTAGDVSSLLHSPVVRIIPIRKSPDQSDSIQSTSHRSEDTTSDNMTTPAHTASAGRAHRKTTGTPIS